MRWIFLLAVACGYESETRNVHRAIEADFNGDGRVDHAKLTDERDGFRTTFAYLDIWLAGEDGYETAKYKDGRWIWIDHAKYPRLAWIMRREGY